MFACALQHTCRCVCLRVCLKMFELDVAALAGVWPCLCALSIHVDTRSIDRLT